MVVGLTDGEWASIAGAFFTAIAALAAFATVAILVLDRWKSAIPNLHVEILGDAVNDEMWMTVSNLGPPARDVRLMGTIGSFGWFAPTAPTTYWHSGESRTYRLSLHWSGKSRSRRLLRRATFG